MKKIAIVVSILGLILAFGGTGNATIWTVDPGGGGDYTTITAAIHAATTVNDDRIDVAAGTYTNDIWDSGLGIPVGYRIAKTLTINGAQAGVNPNSGPRGAESILVRTNGLPYSITAPNVVLDGFMIGSTAANTGGRIIVGPDADGTTIQNTIIQNTPTTSSGHGIYVYPGATGILIDNNTIANTGWEALRIDGGATVSGNVIRDIATNKGIYLGSTSQTVITGNTISDTLYEGIAAFGSATITDNEISGAHHGIQLRGDGTSYTVTGNNIHDNTYQGIEVPNYTNEIVTALTVVGNLLTDNPYCGITVGGGTDGSGYSVNYNNITGNGIYGVESFTSEDLDATNNWWGDASGPGGVGPGTGDGVSSYVAYDPPLAAPVPEPGSLIIWGLLGAGCAGAGVVRRRRRSATGWSEESRQAIRQIVDRGRFNG